MRFRERISKKTKSLDKIKEHFYEKKFSLVRVFMLTNLIYL